MSSKRRDKRAEYRAFWEAVTRGGRAACAAAGPDCFGGPPDAHHFIPKRCLDTAEARRDPRNGVPLCRQHHKQADSSHLRLDEPPELQDFIRDHYDAIRGRTRWLVDA